jgi:hypothetical protein
MAGPSRITVVSVFASFLMPCSAAPEHRAAEGMSAGCAARIAATATPAEIEALQRAWISARFPGAKPDFANSRYILSTADAKLYRRCFLMAETWCSTSISLLRLPSGDAPFAAYPVAADDPLRLASPASRAAELRRSASDVHCHLFEMKQIPQKLQPWFDARRRFKLTDAEVQMARELGMNPKKFGSLANEHQEPWKAPLREFIANCYRKSFGRDVPQELRSLEEVVAAVHCRRARKQERKRSVAMPSSSTVSPQ